MKTRNFIFTSIGFPVRNSGSGESSSIKNTRILKWERGLSYIEVLLTLSILLVIVGVGIPAVGKSKREADAKGLQAEARILNDAIYRVEAGGDRGKWLELSNILHVQKDKNEAVRWLVDHGYIQQRN